MASDSKKGKCGYSETDKVDEYVLNQVTKHVNPEELDSLARELFVEESVYKDIQNPKNRIYKVLYTWLLPLLPNYTVKDLIKELKNWIKEGYVKHAVWKRLQNCVVKSLLPSFSERSELRQRSMSSESLVTDKDSYTSHPLGFPTKASSSDVISAQSAQVTKGILRDSHVFELSKRITSQSELMDLGIKGLKLPKFIIEAALYRHPKDIQDAAHDVLSEWVKQQENVNNNYNSLVQCLKQCQMNQLVAELRQLVEGTTDICTTLIDKICSIQERLRWSLDRRWRDSLRHDWLPEDEGWNFDLMKYYTDLTWVRMVKTAMQKEKNNMDSIYEILRVEGAGCRPLNILIEAKPGMGKTSSMAMLAMEWVKDNKKEFPFDFVFLVPLRNVSKNCSLAEVIIAEHDQLGTEDIMTIDGILKGDTNHKVLLLLDGYDEYTPGTNSQIDKAIRSTIGKCFLLLTSRPKPDHSRNHFLAKHIRNKMDGEVVIEGFSEENIRRCCSQYLGSDQKADEMIQEAIKIGLYSLLHVPILLFMVCVLYNEKTSLPKSRTKLFHTIYKLIIDRATIKTYGCKADKLELLDTMLITLGEFAWEALQNDVGQLLLNRDELETKCPEIMKLGLCHQVDTTSIHLEGQHSFVSFEHKSLQELAAAIYICHELQHANDIQEALKKLFPSWFDIIRFEEVVVFICGLMEDPSNLINHVYQMFCDYQIRLSRSFDKTWLEFESKKELKHLEEKLENTDLFHLLYSESLIPLSGFPLQNQYINWIDHDNDHEETLKNLSKIYIPSKHFEFRNISEHLSDFNRSYDEENRQCSMTVIAPHSEMTESLFAMCSKISKAQEITDLWIQDVEYQQDINSAELSLSKHAQSLTVMACKLPPNLMRHLLEQLKFCQCISTISIRDETLGNNVHLITRAVSQWGTNPPLQELNLEDCSISEERCGEIMKSLTSCQHITQLILSKNHVGTSGKYLAEAIKNWGDTSPLEILHLENCSIEENSCSDILKSLATCQHITDLDLSENWIGHSGKYLAEAINSWGEAPSLEELHLRNCSIPEETCGEILKSLITCQQMTFMNLSGNDIRSSAKYLTEAINNWGDAPLLEQLYLQNCLIPEESCCEILKSLATCQQITHLGLSGNDVGTSGKYLAEAVKNWGDTPLLEGLYLDKCSIAEDNCSDILKSLATCQHITHLDLSENDVGSSGKYLAEAVKNWGDTPLLELLFLENCSIPEEICGDILKYLTSCQHITQLVLSGNDVGSSAKYLEKAIDKWGDDPSLEDLYLENCSMSNEDWCELLQSITDFIKHQRLSKLCRLVLSKNNLHVIEDEVGQLLNAFATEHKLRLKVFLDDNGFSSQFVNHWTEICAGTHLTPVFEYDPDDSTSDEDIVA